MPVIIPPLYPPCHYSILPFTLQLHYLLICHKESYFQLVISCDNNDVMVVEMFLW